MFVVEDSPRSVEAEAYRILRTNIQYSCIDKEIKTIVITSACPGEGKSTVAGNLAISFAENGRKVIVVDCDLRKPSIHIKFNLSNLTGLSDVMIGKEMLDNAIQKYKCNIDILTSGKLPPNPAEILNSMTMSNLINELKEKYDIIVMDTSPLEVFADGQILSTKADGTILVIKAGKSKIDSVNEAINLLKKVGANIIGVVINKVNKRRSKKDYYYEVS